MVFISFFNKIQDGRQNHMSLSIELELLYGFVYLLDSKEEPYPGRVLISFWCDHDNKTLFFFTSQDFT